MLLISHLTSRNHVKKSHMTSPSATILPSLLVLGLMEEEIEPF